MSWLSFNDGLSNIKGQISNFAQSVLNEDDESVEKSVEYEELKKICFEHENEIARLRKENEDLKTQEVTENEAWNWVNTDDGKSEEEIKKLKKEILQLQNENKDLVAQLEQLDTDNQQNVCKLIEVKDTLQIELQNTKEKLNEVERLHVGCLDREKCLQEEIKLNKCELEKQQEVENELRTKYQNLVEEHSRAVNAEKNKENEETKLVQDDLQKLRERCIELEQRYNARLAEEDLQLEDHKKMIKQYAEEIEKLKSSEKELLSKYNDLLKDHEKVVGLNKDAVEVNTSIELSDCHLQDCNTATNQTFEDGYSILKQLFESHSENISTLIAAVVSLNEKYNTEELQYLTQQLKLLQSETKSIADQNEVIHSKYLSNEDFKDTIDDVVLDGLKKENDILKENITQLYADDTALTDDTEEDSEGAVLYTSKSNFNKYVKLFQDIFDSNLSEDIPPERKTFARHSQLKELHNLLKEIYNFMNELKSNTAHNEEEQQVKNLYNVIDELNLDVEEKNKIIKEYENEISELSKNNDLLIAELQVYKKHQLETISEFDEDKIILLEEQLELANDQIRELTNRLENLEANGLNQPDSEEEDSKAEENTYLELLNKFDGLQLQYDMLKKELTRTENELQKAQVENVTLKSTVDSSENSLYLQDELKILNESLQSEIEQYKQKFEMVATNAKLATSSEDYESLKTELNDIKEKLATGEETKVVMEKEILELTEKLKSVKMTETTLKLQLDRLNVEYAHVISIANNLRDELEGIHLTRSSSEIETQRLKNENEELTLENRNLKETVKNQEDLIKKSQAVSEKAKLLEEYKEKNAQLQSEIEILQEENSTMKLQAGNHRRAQNDLIQLINNKHKESVAYHNEVQKAYQLVDEESKKFSEFRSDLEKKNSQLTADAKEKLEKLEKVEEENMNLKEQCRLLSQSLLEEQDKVSQLLENKSSDAETALKKKLERLQTHLIELEEHYTRELYEAEQRNIVLQATVNEVEEREKTSSTMYTSVNIRANQQVESLRNQLQAMTSEKDSLSNQISTLEDTINRQAAGLTNLQLVLEQFRKDKENEIHKETARLRRQIDAERKTQEDLKNEISTLKLQLEESKQGLLAAARLSDQLENSKNIISALKTEVSHLQSSVTSKQEELNAALSQTDGKVDKSLIKNLIIGFVTTNNNLNKDQTQILKIIGTVLDFNQQDHDKLNLNKGLQGSWLTSLLSPQGSLQNVGQESLSRAFVEFLEKESKPRVVPSLLTANAETPASSSRKSSIAGQSPANLSEIVLPTFADFAQNRNSSSILKDVLKDHS